MKIHDSDNHFMKESCEEIGSAAVSRLCSIRAFSKMGFTSEHTIRIEKLITTIDCTLWSLIPLALEIKKHKKEFDMQMNTLNSLMNDFKKLVGFMSELRMSGAMQEKSSTNDEK